MKDVMILKVPIGDTWQYSPKGIEDKVVKGTEEMDRCSGPVTPVQ